MPDEKSSTFAGEVVVSLVGRDVDDARRILEHISRAMDRRVILEGAHRVARTAARSADEARAEAFALELFALREARERVLPPEARSEAAWDILLTAYLAHEAGVRHTAGRVVELSHTSQTTALRNIDALQQVGLVFREQGQQDRRISLVVISREGRKAVHKILSMALKR